MIGHDTLNARHEERGRSAVTMVATVPATATAGSTTARNSLRRLTCSPSTDAVATSTDPIAIIDHRRHAVLTPNG
jgi:hypothetical protein